VAWLWDTVTGRNRKVRHGQGAPRARWFAGAAIVFNLAFLGIVAACNPMAIVFGYPLTLRLGMLLPLLSMVPTVAALVCAVLAWRDRLWSMFGRVHFTLVALAIPVFLWQLRYWHLLGWRL
jgi:hypothetical protein